MRAPLILILILPSFLDAQIRPNNSSFARRYEAIVDAYRKGDTAGSIKAVLGLDTGDVMELVDHYVKMGYSTDRQAADEFFRAASVLHADAAFLCWGPFGNERCWAHLVLARHVIDASERPGAPPGSFRRRWYAATALMASNRLVTDDALEYFEDAVRKFPDDVPLLTAAGWFSERLSRSAASPAMTLKHAQQSRRRHELNATRLLAAALQVDPRAQEAALRLARIELSSGQAEAARNRLAVLLARDDVQRQTAYVARLTLGDINEREGNTGEAERQYREALTLDPIAQSARVALAQLLYASGDSPAAADLVEPAVTKATQDANDPWSEYQLAYPFAGQLLFDQLRAEVQR